MEALQPCASGLGSLAAAAAPHKATTSPIVTGSSVLALRYRDGVMMAADTLGSYGSMAKFTDLTRLRSVGRSTLIGASGEYSDFQYIMDLLEELVRGQCGWGGEE
jgi:20S proteasome subunit beta 7